MANKCTRSKKMKRCDHLTVRLYFEENAQITLLAKELGVSRSEFIRKALASFAASVQNLSQSES